MLQWAAFELWQSLKCRCTHNAVSSEVPGFWPIESEGITIYYDVSKSFIVLFRCIWQTFLTIFLSQAGVWLIGQLPGCGAPILLLLLSIWLPEALDWKVLSWWAVVVYFVGGTTCCHYLSVMEWMISMKQAVLSSMVPSFLNVVKATLIQDSIHRTSELSLVDGEQAMGS